MTLHGSASQRQAESQSVLQRWAHGASLMLAAVGCVAVGTALGLALTYGVVTDDDGIGAARVGPWRFWPDAGRPDLNPYLRARFALSGEIPHASAEGLSIVAREDDGGQPLRRQCSYRIAGGMPDAQFWTIEATSETGAPLDNPAHRFSFTAADILRDEAGRVVIEAAPRARPGNWLPLVGDGRFVLVLRVYGPQAAAGGAKSGLDVTLPSIALGQCG